MAEVHHISIPERKGVRAWLRLGRSQSGGTSRLSLLAQQLREIAPGTRSDVIARIAEFFDRHDLDVCQDALAVAHDYVTQADPLLVRLIDMRERGDEAVTIEWLRKLRGQGQPDMRGDELQRTFEKLERELLEFGATASAARQATHDYGVSLEGHVEQLGNVEDVTTSVSDLLEIVRTMIVRTSEMERDMSRSESQSRELRKNLEAALRSADEDHLTGLPNRRAFERIFEQEYREARLALDSLVVAFCDIDNFKRVNDTHGHDTGDRVLKVVARSLSSISNDHCHVARYGGEEFVVLFRRKALEKAIDMLDDIRTALSERRLIDRRSNAAIGYVTFSAGVADVFAHPDRRTALKAADVALYLAKEQGRNRVIAARS